MQAKLLPTSILFGLVRLGQAQQAQIPLVASKPSSIPLLGYGTWNLESSNVSEAVSIALHTGYKHLDCAAVYGNQNDVGKGIAHGLEKAGLDRSDIWVTSKLWNDQ
jgi:alcohol dehydrogenase (NADP+)